LGKREASFSFKNLCPPHWSYLKGTLFVLDAPRTYGQLSNGDYFVTPRAARTRWFTRPSAYWCRATPIACDGLRVESRFTLGLWLGRSFIGCVWQVAYSIMATFAVKRFPNLSP